MVSKVVARSTVPLEVDFFFSSYMEIVNTKTLLTYVTLGSVNKG